MQTAETQPDIASTVRPAYHVAFLLTVLAGLAVLALAISGLGLYGKACLVVVLVIYTGLVASRLLKPSIVRIGFDGECLVTAHRQGHSSRLTLRGQPFVSPVYFGLALVDDRGRKSTLGLFRSQLDSTAWRRILVRFQSRTNY